MTDLDPPPNQLTVSSRMQATTVNLLKNHSYETTGNWSAYTSGACTFTRDSSVSYLGDYSFKIYKPDSSYGYYYQILTLEKGAAYTFSAWVKTSDLTYSENSAKLRIRYMNNQGSYVYLFSQMNVYGTTDWTRIQMNFTLPVDASSNSVQFHLYLMV